jgi:outer membrane receptor protein involved in Fe transport
MNEATVDREYERLEKRSEATAELIKRLADKMSARAAAGDANAREWSLDLREIAIAVRDEEQQTRTVISSIQDLVDEELRQQPQQQAVRYQQGPYQGYGYGGGFNRFLGGGFGQALAMGAGFGLGEEIIEDIF